MFFLANSLFWGSILILVGIILILKIFPIFRHISVGRIIAGFILIYIGLSVLFGERFFLFQNRMKFTRVNKYKPYYNYRDGSYEVVFQDQTIDISEVAKNSQTKNIKITVVFGSARIKANRDTKVVINGSVAFGKVSIPGGNNFFFGEYSYSTDNQGQTEETIFVNANVVFGNLNIIEEY